MQVTKDSIDLGIVVTDEKAALAFYRDGLGLEWEGELPVPGGRMYRLKCGTTVIKLLKLERTPAAKPAPGGPAGGLGYRYFTISVPDIRGLISQLEAKGIRPSVPVTESNTVCVTHKSPLIATALLKRWSMPSCTSPGSRAVF